MTVGEPIDLGHDVLFYDRGPLDRLAGRTRFLDVLWLPCALAELNLEQISVISRFREARIRSDPQFTYSWSARNIVIQTLEDLHISRVLEIGCGKFPLVHDLPLARYRAIEVDGVAIEYSRTAGIEIGTACEFSDRNDLETFDAAVALYAFHFSTTDALIAVIDRSLARSGVLVFNIIVDSTINCMSMLANLSARFQFCEVIKSSDMANREFFFVMSKRENYERANVVAGHLKKLACRA
jgi:SAM-dependent methyltransferase